MANFKKTICKRRRVAIASRRAHRVITTDDDSDSITARTGERQRTALRHRGITPTSTTTDDDNRASCAHVGR
jgi:hypothetical protein